MPKKKNEPLFSPTPPTNIAESVRRGVESKRPMRVWGEASSSPEMKAAGEAARKRKREAVQKFRGK